jgi:multidrug efflux pump subunit AcrA (membrane-fusion protein)
VRDYHGGQRLSRSGGQRRRDGGDAGGGQARDVVFDIPDPAKVEAQRAEEFQVALLSDAGVKAYAVLRDISPQADPQTRTWRVRATLKKPPAAMALGASVTVRLPSSGSTGYAIPASALSRCGEKPAVFVITPQMQAQLRVVVPASYTASSVIIASGLMPGDRVITAGVSKLRPGKKSSPERSSREKAPSKNPLTFPHGRWKTRKWSVFYAADYGYRFAQLYAAAAK